MMCVQGCLRCLIYILIPAALGQNNVFKPGYNFQTLGRQTNPSANAAPSKPSLNTVLNYGKVPLPGKDTIGDSVPHIEVMDFYVPAHPYIGQDFEMTCGYKHQEGLALQRIEWHRNKVTSAGFTILHFRYLDDVLPIHKQRRAHLQP